MAGRQAEVRELVDHIRAAGFKTARSGKGHHLKVLTKSGQVVTDANGPLIITGSPGDMRWREMFVNRLMGAGVLKKDPYKATSEGDTSGRGSKLKDPEVRARALQAQREKSERARERSMRLRSRIEPIIARLGGWSFGRSSIGVSPLQFADIVFFWAVRERRPELPDTTLRGEPITVDHLRSAVERLRKPDETVPERWLPLLEAFAGELEQDDPPDPVKSAEHYRELLREQRRLPPAGDDDDDVFEPEQRTLHDHLANVTARHNGNGEHEMLGPLYESDEGLPLLALEVLYRIDPAATDWDAARDLATKIARLERSGR